MEPSISKNNSFKKLITSDGTSTGTAIGQLKGNFDTEGRTFSIEGQLTADVADNASVQRQITSFVTYARAQASDAGLTQFGEPTA